jgi:hypothetical protein
MTISSGNLGLGVTPSAWDAGAYIVQQNSIMAFASGGSEGNVLHNAFYNSSSWKYINTNFATRYFQGSGEHRWFNAPSGTAGNAISFTQAMTLGSNSGLSIGTTTAAAANGLRVQGNIFSSGDFEIGSASSFITANNTRIAGTDRKIQVWNNISAYIDVLNFAPLGAATFSSTIQSSGLTLLGPTGAGTGPSLVWDRVGGYGSFNATYKYESTFFANGSTLQFQAGAGITTFRMAVNNAATAGNIHLFPDGGGNVGIGTSSPSYKLDITALGYGIQHYGNSTNSLRTYAGSGYQVIEATTSTGVSQFGYVSGNFFVEAGGSERMRITSGGNVGIGTSSPASPSSFAKTMTIYDASSASYSFNVADTYKGEIGMSSGGGWLSTYTNDPFRFITNNTERMRITSGGNVLIGDTSDYLSSRLNLKSADSTSSTNIISCRNSSGTDYFRVRSDGYTYALGVYNNTTGSGANVFVGAGGDFLRSTSSLKYKNSIRDYDKGLDIVNQLRPVYYKGNNDGDTIFAGLIAEEVHELGLTEFVQYAEDGTPDALAYQNMIALAFKAIQEQQAQIEELKAKIK